VCGFIDFLHFGHEVKVGVFRKRCILLWSLLELVFLRFGTAISIENLFLSLADEFQIVNAPLGGVVLTVRILSPYQNGQISW
jgi:hypothetical protein